MRYKADYIGYELGYFLLPDYTGHEKCDVFFLLLQNPIPDTNAETFGIRLGKTRSLDAPFYSDCLMVLVYLAVDGGRFSVYPVNLKEKKDGSKYFDAESFLKQMGIEYKPADTAGYRYFKRRLRESRREIIMKEDSDEFSIIHRRINADDFESLTVHRNTKDALKSAYFLTIRAFDRKVNYREIMCFATEEELKDYIKNEFSATDGEEIASYTIAQLMEGKSYEQGHRMGAGTTRIHVQVIHDSNLVALYRFLDSAELEDDDGEPVRLSSYLQKANSFENIEEVIFAFNESCENYW